MNFIFQEVEKALHQQNYYSAILLTLTIPDMCAALEADNGMTTKPKYLNWCSENIIPYYQSIIQAEDLYYLRCGVVHKASATHKKMPNYERVVFTIPNSDNNRMHCNVINNALNLDAEIFCKDVISIARKWFLSKKGDPLVQKNLQNIVSFYPNGLMPYIYGVPVIT